MDRPSSARTDSRSGTQRPRRVAPRTPPRRPSALPPSQPRPDEDTPRPPGLPVSAIVRGLPATVGAVGLAFFVVQAALGWGLGVAGAGLTVLVAVSLLAVIFFTDVLRGGPEVPHEDDESYDLLMCTVVAVAVAIAIACLYLPLPWGGLCAAAVLAVLAVSLRML